MRLFLSALDSEIEADVDIAYDGFLKIDWRRAIFAKLARVNTLTMEGDRPNKDPRFLQYHVWVRWRGKERHLIADVPIDPTEAFDISEPRRAVEWAFVGKGFLAESQVVVHFAAWIEGNRMLIAEEI